MLAVSTSELPDSAAGERPRRRAPWRSAVVWGLSLLLFAGIAYGGWRLLRTPADSSAIACPSASAAVPAVPSVALRVLNGTTRPGLAGSTADLLRQRGFRIVGVGNAARLSGRSQVRYGTRDALAARIASVQLPSAVLVADKKISRRVDIVLGSAFRGLRSPAQVAAATKRAKLPTPRPASSGPCR